MLATIVNTIKRPIFGGNVFSCAGQLQSTMLERRRQFLTACLTVTLGFVIVSSALRAQPRVDSTSFPTRPIKLLVGANPGGNIDITARIVAKHLADVIGQPVVIENRAGAGGAIAFNIARQATGDPYTLLMAPTGFTSSPALNPSAGYDPVKDFTPVSSVSFFSYAVAVGSESPYRTLGELLAAARSQPNTIGYGTGGVGSGQHLVAELLSAVTGVRLVHIPYKGGATPMTDLISGQIPMLVEIESILAPEAAAGKLRVLAITGPVRSTILPDVPTMAEAGIPDFVVQGWLGIVAPRGIEPEIITKLNTAIRLTLSDGDTIAALARGGATVRASSATEFGALIESETIRWSKVVRGAAIQTR